MGDLIVFAKSRDAINDDRRELFAEFDREWARMLQEREVAYAKLHGSVHTMSDRPLIKKAKIELAAKTIENEALKKFRDAIYAMNDGLGELNRLEKRSERFFGGVY